MSDINVNITDQIVNVDITDAVVLVSVSSGPGPTGPIGPTGQGVPVGGTTGQALVKNSNTNYDTIWSTIPNNNIYNADGTLTGNRLVTMGSYTLSFEKDIFINGIRAGTGQAQSLPIGFADSNTIFGINALDSITTGYDNSAFGWKTLSHNTTGQLNSAFGLYALYYNVTGNYNTAIGVDALKENYDGYDNVAVGVGALMYNTSGYKNTAIGVQAARYSNTTGSNNIYIGADCQGVSNSESNRTWIGNGDTLSTWLGGNLLLGTTTNSTYKLDVLGSARVSNLFIPSVGNTVQTTKSLHIYNGNDVFYVLPSGGSTELFMRGNNPELFNWYYSIVADTNITHTAGPYIENMYFKLNGNNNLTFKRNGNTVIGGTIDSIYKLDVQGTTRISSTTTLSALAGTGNRMVIADSTGVLSTQALPIDTGLTSVGLSMPVAFSVANSPLTANGTLAVTAIGTSSQYIRGDGQLATLPSGSSGGSSVNYYLNGSVNQGTIGGSVYYEMNRNAVIGTGTNFTRLNSAGNGLIAQFITDANDPNRLEIPSGAWNFEMYFNSSSSGGSPAFYVELLKYNGTTFTSIANGSTNPEVITGGTSIDLYLNSLAVPQTTLLATDRLVIRVYVTTSGKDITLYTEDNHLCQIITTFAGGIAALNGLTANTQYFAVGTSGTDFAISSLTDTHTFNLPTASATNRGALSSADWSTFNGKVSGTGISGQVAYWSGTSTQTGSNNLFWDNTNARLGIGRSADTDKFEVQGNARLLGSVVALKLQSNATGDQFQVQYDGTWGRFIGVSTTYLAVNKSTGNTVLQNGGTFTDGGQRLQVQGTTLLNGASTISGSTTASSGVARNLISSTLVASANNDVLVGLDVNPTFTNGAFTGVSNLAARFTGTIYSSNFRTTNTTYQFRQIAIGTPSEVGAGTTGINNISLGGFNGGGSSYTGLSLTTGNDNVFIGYGTGGKIVTGSNNIGIGARALESIASSTANGNTVVGNISSLTLSGNNNTAIGNGSSFNATTGSNNIFLGYFSARYQADGSTNLALTGNNNIYIGQFVRGFNNTDTNAIVIGSVGVGLGSNTTVIGNSSTTDTAIYGRMLVNYATPVIGTYALDVNGTARVSGGTNGSILLVANYLGFNTGTNGLSVTNNANTTEILRLFNNGNLLIQNGGTYVDNGYRLDVSGTARIQGNVTISDGKHILLGTTTGTRIGTTTSQKLSLWDATPDVQPTTTITAAAFVMNTSGILNDTATFGGYTIGQIVAALKRIGALA